MIDYAEPLDEADGSATEGQEPDRLMQFAQTPGDISHLLKGDELATLGQNVVEDYERDEVSRADWKTKVEKALASAAQETGDAKTYPWANASNVHYPILTVAAQQFAARAMPAILKGDEAVGVKVIGEAPKQPEPDQPKEGEPPEQAQQKMQAAQQAFAAFAQREQVWEGKQARAKRVKTYLNYQLFYGMDDWEGDTDALLNQIPITGMGFRKVYYDADRGSTCSEFVSALHLTVPMDTKSLARCPRITQDFELYPYEIRSRIKQGLYRDVTLNDTDEDKEHPRTILEQHRLEDMDEDGIAEPYIVTVDKETQEVLRIEAAFGEDDLEFAHEGGAGPAHSTPVNGVDLAPVDGPPEPRRGKLIRIKRWVPYVKYPFLPDPKGRFYGIGFGHLLGPLTDVINTSINELIDAGNAQNAGGGFMAGGLRLQGAGQGSSLYFKPGEYKVVNATGTDLRNAIWERTLPAVSPVLFQLLDLILGAAKEISSVKDVLTGEASNTAPVGTTLALIEQGLQSFTSIYKRVFRSLKEEFQLLYECEARYGKQYGDVSEYADIVDDPEADFEKDFSQSGHDIVPVSDPTVVTKMQSVAKAQMLMQFAETPIGMASGLDPKKVAEIVLEAGDIESEGLFGAPKPPDPMVVAEVELKNAQTKLALAQADKATHEAEAVIPKAAAEVVKGAAQADAHHATAHRTDTETAIMHHMAPHEAASMHANTINTIAQAASTLTQPQGTTDGPDQGGSGDMAGQSGDEVGDAGAGGGGGSAAPDMAASLLGIPGPGPIAPEGA